MQGTKAYGPSVQDFTDRNGDPLEGKAFAPLLLSTV
jgi:hypothetical protein